MFAISPPVRDIARGEGNASRMAHEADVGEYMKKAASVFDLSALRDSATRKRYARMGWMFLRARMTKLLRKMGIGNVDPTPWVSRSLINQLVDLGERSIPVQFVYGAAEDDSTDYLDAKAGPLGGPAASADLIETIVEGRVHNLGSVEIQDAVIEMIVSITTARADGAGH
jgi:hypothetical protein